MLLSALLGPAKAPVATEEDVLSAGGIYQIQVVESTAGSASEEVEAGEEGSTRNVVDDVAKTAELVARVRALLRRTLPEAPRVLGNGPLGLDLGAADARLGDTRLHLTRREFDLLAFLTQNAGRVYSRAELLDRVWGADFLGGERTVDQHVTQLRAHLGDDPARPRFLETVRGKGYRMRPWTEGS